MSRSSAETRSAVCVGCGCSETVVGDTTGHIGAKVIMSGWVMYSAGPVYLCSDCKEVWWHRLKASDLNLDLQRRRREQGIYKRMRLRSKEKTEGSMG